jgi:MGT family glycosyltransferase
VPRALFLGLPLHGHTNPTLPLVEGLVTRGHEVVYYATDPFAPAIERTGASYRPYRNTHLNHTADIPARMDELAYLLTRTASEVLDVELEGMRTVGADYVITDASAPWGHWVAEALGLPVLTSVTTFAFNRQVMRYGLAHGVRPKSLAFLASKLRHLVRAVRLQRAMRRRHGLKGPNAMTAMFGRSGLNIVYTSRMFQPCAETFDSRYVFVGPMTTRVEDSQLERLSADGPLVYVSLGTLFNDNPGFYRTCFAAFRGEPYRVTVSVGKALGAIAALGEPPPNVQVRAHVPQLQLLQNAAAFVTHGGMNSVVDSYFRCAARSSRR